MGESRSGYEFGNKNIRVLHSHVNSPGLRSKHNPALVGFEHPELPTGGMDLKDGQRSLLDGYLEHFDPLIGDRRTGRALRATVEGIIGAETLVAARIAAFSP